MNGRTRQARGAGHSLRGERERSDSGSVRSLERDALSAVLRDVQTPLAALELNLALLADDLADTRGEALVSLRDARGAARRIRQYVDHFIESEIFGAAAMRKRRRRFDLGALLERLAAEYRQHVIEHAIEIELVLPIDPVMCARGDEVLLERVFQNLLEAVLRRPAAGGRVRIEAHAASVIEIAFSRAVSAAQQPDWGDHLVSSLARFECERALQAHGGCAALQADPSWAARVCVRLPAAAL